MSLSRNFTVPDYYPDFACKIGGCRSCCCRGWEISVTLGEYLRMLGLEVSPELRRKLDCAFRPAETPDEFKYAYINKGFTGDCPLHESDGRCGLQRECGEDVLTSVCRYYPRSPKVRYADECSCANACEGVLELLMSRREPIGFIEMPITFVMPEAEYTHSAVQTEAYTALRKLIIGIIQDRTHTLPQRLLRVGTLCSNINQNSGFAPENAVICDFDRDFRDAELYRDDARALNIMTEFVKEFDSKSDSLAKYGESALDLIANGGDYDRARELLYSKFPDFDIYMEQILVNHIFYTTFPYSDAHESASSDFHSLCAAYALLRFLAAAHAEDIKNRDDLVDIYASAFRLIECSNFDRRSAAWLHTYAHDNEKDISCLLSI